MSPLARMCAMVLAVQAAAVKTSAGESAGAKTIDRLGSEVMLGMKNASAMLGELEKMAMSSSEAGPSDELVRNITDILTKAILASFPQQKIDVVDQNGILKGVFDACAKDESNDGLIVSEKATIDDAKANFTACRAHSLLNPTTGGGTHTVCQKLDRALEAVSDAVGTLEGAYPTFPIETDVDGRVAYVKMATDSKVCQAPDVPELPIIDQWIACQGETITNLQDVDTHKDSCLAQQAKFEGHFCDWRATIRAELVDCARYVECQKSARNAQTTYNGQIATMVDTRKAEKLAVKKIVCYLDKWSANTAEGHREEFALCMDLFLNGDETLEMEIAAGIPGTVDKTCPVTASIVEYANVYPAGPELCGTEPCSAAWEVREYGALNGGNLDTRVETKVKDTTFALKEYVHDVLECLPSTALEPPAAGLLQAHDSAPIAAKPITAEKPKREKKLVRREPKKPKASSLAELDSQGRMTNVKVQAQKHTTTELHDMDMDALMDLVKSSGANTAAVKAAMTKSIMKLQAQASAV